jgi:two-component system, sensor histidine kinase
MHWPRQAWGRPVETEVDVATNSGNGNGVSSRPDPLILNVNDSEGARYLVTLMLRKAGFLVTEAATGTEALESVQRRKPDLIVLDLQLPDLNGLEVCRRIRQNSHTASIKILHTSATYVTVDNKIQSLDGGADGYLAQPFESQELVATVNSLLRLNQTEQDLRQHADQLREADRRKNEFLSMLAHELRNPLAAITASLSLLDRRDPLDDVERRARDVLARQSSNLGRLIDDLLDVARVTQGKIEFKWEAVDLRQLLERVVENTLQTKITPRGQALSVRLPSEPLYVRGDATRLEQIFTNLLDNASKYTDKDGAILLALEGSGDAGSGDAGKPLARVLVSDEGIGMSQDTLPNIFGLFSQADVPIARSRGGLGIGLTLVRTLVELHGGSVRASSRGLGQGSQFEVSLPLANDAELAQLRNGGAARPLANAVRRRIVLVEDNPDAQQMLADLLAMWGHHVDCASDGLEGVEKVLALRPDVALVDLGLPGIDGYEVARRVRQAPEGRQLTLIALTGYGAPEQKARALAAGFDVHLVKPVDAPSLSALLAQRHSLSDMQLRPAR